MRNITISLLIIICSCSRKDQPLTDAKQRQLQTYFEERYKAIDNTIKVDSFRFVRIDSITLKEKCGTMLVKMTKDFSILDNELDNSLKLLKTKLRLANLSYGMSRSLYNNYKGEADDEKKNFDKIIGKSNILEIRIDSIKSLYAKADSIIPVAYDAVCLYQIRHKDQSVEKDSAYILLNKEYNIIDKDKFYNY